MTTTGNDGELVIRAATLGDEETILGMIEGLAHYEKMSDEVVATPERLRNTLFGERPDAYCLLAEVDARTVGIAIYFYTYSTFLAQRGLHLEDLFVLESHRGRGYGEQILRHLAQVAVDEGCGRFEWTVLDWNQPAIDFYHKMGAEMLKEWRICRVAGSGLSALAAGA